jgi:uncharacterized protein YjiS (DUF1127 family)
MELYFSPFGGASPIPRALRRIRIRGGLAPPRFGAVRRLIALIRLWRRRAYERRLLARFGERDRRDLALTVPDIEREVSKPFWRA